MEKKNYKRPIMQIEEFVANHFIAACSEVTTMVKYEFWVISISFINRGIFLTKPNNFGLSV